MVELVSDHLDTDTEPIEDEPDSRERMIADGSSIIVTSPASEPALNPDEIVGFAPNGYPESRAQRAARMERQTGGYQAFDSAGRPI